jgi:hypothetical protein
MQFGPGRLCFAAIYLILLIVRHRLLGTSTGPPGGRQHREDRRSDIIGRKASRANPSRQFALHRLKPVHDLSQELVATNDTRAVETQLECVLAYPGESKIASARPIQSNDPAFPGDADIQSQVAEVFGKVKGQRVHHPESIIALLRTRVRGQVSSGGNFINQRTH